ncbi:MAG: TolC family protein [Nitrospirae bacterium]|nr:TolC family protein [Nitrospirota bacterium]
MKLQIIYLLFILSFILINPLYAEESDQKITKISISLTEAIALALNRNTVIKGNDYTVQGAVLIKNSAESEFDLNIAPELNAGLNSYDYSGLGVGLSKKFLTGTLVTVTPGFYRDMFGYNTVINTSISQPLLRGFGVFYNSDKIDSSDYSLKAAKLQMFQKKTEIALDTIKTAYNAARYKETIDHYKSFINRLNGYIQTSKIKEEVGLATPMDVYRAEIGSKQVSSSLSEEKELYENTINHLKTILALPLTTELEVMTPMEIEPFILTDQEAVNTALIYSIALKQNKIDIEEAKRKSEIARQNILPDLNLVLDFNKTQYIDSSIGTNPQYYGIMLKSSTDIFRKQEKTTYQLSIIKINSLNLDLSTKKDELIRQVLQQRYALKKAQELMIIKAELIKYAKGKLALARLKFDHEMADNFDLITAETELNTAEDGLLEARINYISAIYDMRAVLGTLIEYKDE